MNPMLLRELRDRPLFPGGFQGHLSLELRTVLLALLTHRLSCLEKVRAYLPVQILGTIYILQIVLDQQARHYLCSVNARAPARY